MSDKTAEQQPQSPQVDPEVEKRAVAMAAEARRRREMKELGGDDGEDRTAQQAVRAAARGEKLDPDEIHDAVELFLAEEGEEPEIEPQELKLNLGTRDKPKYVAWTVVPVDDEEIVQIRKRSSKGNRARRRAGEADIDENLVARRIVVKGTVNPDLAELGKSMRLADPADALLAYFRRFGKTGLILQISGEILNISGYDEDDISELDAALG